MIRSIFTILAVLCLASSASAFDKKWTKVEVSPNHPVNTVFGPFPSCANIDIRQDSLSTGVVSVYSAGATDSAFADAEAGTLAKQFSSADGTTITNIAPDEEGWAVVVDTAETVDGAGIEWSCSQYGNPVAVGGGSTGAPPAAGGASKELWISINYTGSGPDNITAAAYNNVCLYVTRTNQPDLTSAGTCNGAGTNEKIFFTKATTVTGFYLIIDAAPQASSQCAFQLADSSATLFGTEIDVDSDVDTVTLGSVFSVTGMTESVVAGGHIMIKGRESGGEGTCSFNNFGKHWLVVEYEDA